MTNVSLTTRAGQFVYSPETCVSLLQRMSDPLCRSDAWNLFLERYTALIQRWCEHWGVKSIREDDIFQETMIRVLNSIDFFERRRDGSFRLWLKTLAHSSWVELSRQQRRQLALRKAAPRCFSEWAGLTSKEGYDHLTELCDVWATQEIIDLAAERVRQRVDQSTWLTYELLASQNQSVAQVSEKLEVSHRQVYNRFFRVKQYLKLEYDQIDARES